MQRTDQRPWSWERLKAEEEDSIGWDGWMASPTQWAWVWASSGSWWWTGKPGVLQSMGSQRVGHNWVTELIGCTPYKVIIMLLTIFPFCTLHPCACDFILFYNWHLLIRYFISYSLSLIFPIPTCPKPPCPSGNHWFVPCICGLFLFYLFISFHF